MASWPVPLMFDPNGENLDKNPHQNPELNGREWLQLIVACVLVPRLMTPMS